MKSKKIKLDEKQIEYLSEIMQEKKISLRDAISEWNHKQEVEKYLGAGDIVKIKTDPISDHNGKQGFIVSVLHPVGVGWDPERSGKFSVYWFDYEDSSFQADFLGYELEPTGKRIDRDFLEDYKSKINPIDNLYYELESALEIV